MAVARKKLEKMTRAQLEEVATRRKIDAAQFKTKRELVDALAVKGRKKAAPEGRPTKYEARFVEEIVAWFDVEKYKDIVIERMTRETKQGETTTEKFKRVANDLPTLQGFARSIGVTHATLLNWANDVVDVEAVEPQRKHPEFFEAYNVAKELQKDFLVQNGLQGHYPPASFIFVAKNITDMTDKQIIETKDIDYKEKHSALDDWFNSLRNNAQSTKRDVRADQEASADIQT